LMHVELHQWHRAPLHQRREQAGEQIAP
jgi:hypothetical protein